MFVRWMLTKTVSYTDFGYYSSAIWFGLYPNKKHNFEKKTTHRDNNTSCVCRVKIFNTTVPAMSLSRASNPPRFLVQDFAFLYNFYMFKLFRMYLWTLLFFCFHGAIWISHSTSQQQSWVFISSAIICAVFTNTKILLVHRS